MRPGGNSPRARAATVAQRHGIELEMLLAMAEYLELDIEEPTTEAGTQPGCLVAARCPLPLCMARKNKLVSHGLVWLAQCLPR